MGPIGIDFSLEAIHLVQLKAAINGLPEVHARASLEYDCSRGEILKNPLQFRSLINRALAADDFYRRQVVIAVPSGMFRTVSINYQSEPDEQQQAAAVLNVMRDRVDGELSDYVLDFLPVKSRSQSDMRLAIVAFSQRQQIVDFLELSRKARLDVLSLEIGPVAISRLVRALSTQSGSGNVLVINSGRRASYLTMISGTDLLFDQEVAFGENGLVELAAETLEMSEAMVRDLILRTGVDGGAKNSSTYESDSDANLANTMSEILKPNFLKLVEEIKRVCLYAAAETRGGAVSQIYLLGSVARWPGSDRLLSSLIGARVAKIPDPLALFPTGAANDDGNGSATLPEIVVATGAALRGMQCHD
jgi:Tfp pilus assembly PilM family ATPase